MALFQEEQVTQEQFDKKYNLNQPDTFTNLGYDNIIKQRQETRQKRIDNEKQWVSNIISPDKVKEWENKGAMTAIEVWHKKNKNELMPYMGTWKEGTKSFDLKHISDKIKEGQVVTPEERQKFENFVLDLAEIQTRGYTVAGNAMNIGLETIPFMAEFGIGLLTSGGTASVGATASKLSTEVLKKGIKKQIAEGAAKTLYNAAINPKTYAFTATRLPQQVRARMGDIMLSDSVAISPEGQAILKESEEKPAIAFMKALGLTNIETASELSGAMLVRPVIKGAGELGKVIASPILKRLPQGFSESFVKLAEQVTKMPFMQAVRQLGYDGMLEEIGEERVGDLLQFAFNLDGEKGYSFEQLLDALFPPPEQLFAESLSFGATGLAMHGIHKGIKALPKAGEKYTKDGFLIDAGIFRIAGYDSYLDKKVKEELNKQGKSEDEIDNAIHFSTRDDKVQFLKETNTQFDSKKEFDAKEFEKDLKRAEIEEKTYEKFTQGGKVENSQAFGLSKLFGTFYKKYATENEQAKEKFDNWFNKFDVRYDVPVNSDSKTSFQNIFEDVYNITKDIILKGDSEKISDLFDYKKELLPLKEYFSDVLSELRFRKMPEWMKENELQLGGHLHLLGTNTIYLNYEQIGSYKNKEQQFFRTILHEMNHAKQYKLIEFAQKNKNNKTLSKEDRKKINEFLELNNASIKAIKEFKDFNKKYNLNELKNNKELAKKYKEIHNKYANAYMETDADNVALALLAKIGKTNNELLRNYLSDIETIETQHSANIQTKELAQIYSFVDRIRKNGNDGLPQRLSDRIDTKTFFQAANDSNDRNLIMTHASKSERLDDILRDGELVAPSMAITKKGQKELAEKHFGDVLFVRNPELINYRKDNIFDRDIYSPRLPAPAYKTKWGGFVSSFDYDSMVRQNERDPKKFEEIYGRTFEEYFDGAKKVIFKGYTPSGKRKLVDYNSKNLVKWVKQEGLIGGESWHYGLSSFLAKLSLKQTSKKELKKSAENSLQDREEAEKEYDKLQKEYTDLLFGDITKYYKFAGNSYQKISDEDFENIMYAIYLGSERRLSEYIDVEKLPKELYDKLKDFVDRASKLPRSYFEAKPLREVNLTEFSYALAEKGVISEKQKKDLKGWGVQVVEYEKGKLNETLENLDAKEGKVFFQEENDSEEKLIAGYTYPEVMGKLTELYEQLGDENYKLSKAEEEKLLAKVHVLEDAFEVSEYPEKFSNEDKAHEIMLNAYYVMNNEEIPDSYIETDAKSQRTYNDYVKLHNEKKEKKEKEYYGYFTEGTQQNIITIMSNANASTALHELGHLFYNGLIELSNASEEAKKQLEAVNKHFGIIGEPTVQQMERFARSFEAYLYKGKAPNITLKQVFENFKEWLKSVYEDITNIKDADISPEVQELFDRMFGDDEYYQERKAANELLKKVKNIVRKERIEKIPIRDDKELDETAKRHKEAAYQILSVGTGKSINYLKTIFEGNAKGSDKKREAIENLIESAEDKITISGGMRDNWKEFFTDTGVSYDNDETGGDYKLVEQALDVIINKSYGNYNFENGLDERAAYYEKAIDEADRQYKVLLSNYRKGNRNVALCAIYEWLEGLDNEIKQDYEDRFIYDSGVIDRNENIDKFDKAKREILSKALELKTPMYASLSGNEQYQETVKQIMKSLDFLQPSDKARLTANILDVPNISFLMSSLDNIMDIAKTMEDINLRRNLEKEIHKELQGTKNVKKNGRTVGKYDYKTNKLFEELRELDRLSPEKANELRLEIGKLSTAEDNGLSFKDKLVNKFLSYKSGGRTFADTELMKELYDEILKIKLAGKSAKSELDLMEKLDESKDIEELINIVQNKKEANFALKGYVNLVANLESTLNALFNKNIKDKYGSEILYAETQAQAWQYEQKQKFEKEVAKIYNLPEWCWDKKIIEYLAEKHTYPEIRRKYDKEGNLLKTRSVDRTLTKMDIIQAYIWSKNEVLEKRLLNQFGEDTLYAMFDELSLEDVKLAESMMRLAQSFYPLVNKAFINKYGLDLPRVSCYFPSTPERGSEVDLYNDYSSKSLNNSFTKQRAQSETQAMDFHNPVATLYNHIDGVSKFVFMSESLDRANLRFKDLDLKRVIINKFGDDAYKTLEQALMNVTYKKEAPVFNGLNKVIDNMVGNWIQANVAVKPIVGLKQLLSANNYAVDMPYMKWQAGFLKALAHPKETIDYVMSIPYIKARYEGSFSNEFLKQTVENSAFAMSKKLKDACNMFIKMGDIGAIIFGGKPYIDYLIEEKGMSESEAIKQFILSTNRSQQSSAISSLSNFQVAAMTRNPMGKLFIAFKNSPQQYVRMCGDAIISVANGDMTKTQCAKVLFQFAYLQPFLYAIATSGSLLRFLFTGDDDDLLKDAKISIFNLGSDAIPLLGDAYKYAINRLVYKEKYLPQTTPLLGDIENEINKISKEDVELKDYLEAIGYLGLHVGLGYNSKAFTNMGSGVGDIATGNVGQGAMKILGYTDKRAKNITGNEKKKKKKNK